MSDQPAPVENCPCPLCGAGVHRTAFSGGDSAFDFPGVFHVVRCGDCDLLYTRARIRPDAIASFYPAAYSAHAVQSPDDRRRARDPWDTLAPFGSARWLDVGCGNGSLIARKKRDGWTVSGVEPSSEAVRAAVESGLDVQHGTIPGVDFGDRRFEVITMLGVIACVPSPRDTLTALRRLLAPRGMLLVSEHNAASAAARLFGPDWQGWDLPRHYSHFTPVTLRRMLRECGFADVTLSFRRRTSRWRHSARRKARSGGWKWSLLAGSRDLCSLASMLLGRGERGDELIAMARAD